MTTGWLPAPVQDLFGPDATLDESYDVLTVDVPPAAWLTALHTARTVLACTYFDWLSAVDEPGTGFRVAAHVVALSPLRRLLLRTTVPHASPALPTAVDIYAGAGWHERETHEMFGVVFTGHPSLTHLLLPDTFEGHPLRKDFVLVARAAKPWPGAKEPGESDHGTPKRRQILPPGVPDPNEWGPQKGQLPTAPARRTPGSPPTDRPRRTRAASEGSTNQPPAPPSETPPSGERPPRRTRSASQGSASQLADAAGTPESGGTTGPATDAPAPDTAETTTGTTPANTTPGQAPTRRSRTASQGSASQRAGDGATTAEPGPAPQGTPAAPRQTPGTPRRSRSASEGSASQRPGTSPAPASGEPLTDPASRQAPSEPASPDETPAPPPAGPRRNRSASQGSASQRTRPPEPTPRRTTAPRSSDAPWHHARPAFDDPLTGEPPSGEPAPGNPPSGEPAPDAPPPQPAPEAGRPETPGTTPKPPAPDPDQPPGEDDDTPSGGPR
ncbi:NADH-quinone oxidoreductase subunit C [Streptomyces sp. 4F14]|uniref:NADH-quinone oxidoreductase subunit C n=1 Tax=Streptomyces sp. 4F14 TaxID=3394380 RepID=UPI003A87F2EB